MILTDVLFVSVQTVAFPCPLFPLCKTVELAVQMCDTHGRVVCVCADCGIFLHDGSHQ